MAESIGSYSLKVTGDAQPLERALHDAITDSKKFTSDLTRVNQEAAMHVDHLGHVSHGAARRIERLTFASAAAAESFGEGGFAGALYGLTHAAIGLTSWINPLVGILGALAVSGIGVLITYFQTAKSEAEKLTEAMERQKKMLEGYEKIAKAAGEAGAHERKLGAISDIEGFDKAMEKNRDEAAKIQDEIDSLNQQGQDQFDRAERAVKTIQLLQTGGAFGNRADIAAQRDVLDQAKLEMVLLTGKIIEQTEALAKLREETEKLDEARGALIVPAERPEVIGLGIAPPDEAEFTKALEETRRREKERAGIIRGIQSESAEGRVANMIDEVRDRLTQINELGFDEATKGRLQEQLFTGTERRLAELQSSQFGGTQLAAGTEFGSVQAANALAFARAGTDVTDTQEELYRTAQEQLEELKAIKDDLRTPAITVIEWP